MTASEAILARSILQEVQTTQEHAQQKHDKKMKPIIMRMDAASTITALSRPGVGRLKHVDIRDLWLQDQVKMKRLKIVKVPGTENIADLATKYHPTSKLSELQQMIGLVPQSEQQLMMTEQANSNSQTTSKLIIPAGMLRNEMVELVIGPSRVARRTTLYRKGGHNKNQAAWAFSESLLVSL
jgi:hypothetical protein